MNEREAAGDISRIQSEIAVLFRRGRIYFRDAARDVHPDLQPSAYAILVRLVDDGPMRASTLVDYFATDKGAISRQITHLESLGFAIRSPDPYDKRAQLIEASARGKRRCRAAREKHRAVTRKQLGSWDPGEVAALADLLAKFNNTGSSSDAASEPTDD